MKKIYAIAGLCALLSGLCAPISAQQPEASYALPFVSVVRDAALSGMAGAGSSTGGAYAVLRNPAASAFAGVSAVEAGYQSWAPDGTPSTNLNFGGAFRIGEEAALGVAFASGKGQAYDVISAGGASAGQFTPSDILFGLGGAYAVTPQISIGGSFKYASQKLSSDDSFGSVALDLSAVYRAGECRAAVGVSNLLGSVKDAAGNSFSLPCSVFAAGDWTKSLSGGSVTVAADLDYFLKGGLTAALGAQYMIKDIVSLRAGYHLGTDGAPVPSYASVGAGVRFAGVGLDASYLLGNDIIGGSLVAALSYRF